MHLYCCVGAGLNTTNQATLFFFSTLCMMALKRAVLKFEINFAVYLLLVYLVTALMHFTNTLKNELATC